MQTNIFTNYTKVPKMKLLVRASVLSIALAGLVAGFASNHSAEAQGKALSNQVVSAAIPAPPLCPMRGCDIGK